MNDFERAKADIAWNKLKGRLQEDNLLVEHKQSHVSYILENKKALVIELSLAAMLAVAFIFYSSSFSDNKSGKKMAMLEQVNNQESSLVTTLADGSIVYLAKDGKLEYPQEFIDKTRNVSLNGEAFFNVAKNREKPFIINTQDVIIEVLGTSFSITNSKDVPFLLNVRSGSVKVSDRKSNQVVYVRKGQCVSLLSGKLKSFASKENPLNSFIKDFRFKDQSLRSIVDVLNTLSDDDKIRLSDNIDTRRLTVAFSGEDINQMAQLIGLAMNLNIEKRNNIIVLSDK